MKRQQPEVEFVRQNGEQRVVSTSVNHDATVVTVLDEVPRRFLHRKVEQGANDYIHGADSKESL